MVFIWFLPVRIASLLFALVELGLTAYVVHYSDDYFYEDPYGDWGVNGVSPSQVNFLVFASIWSLLALVYLAIVAPALGSTSPTERSTGNLSRYATNKWAVFAVDAVTAIFWLGGWIALAMLVGGPSTCTTFCAAIQASVAFAAFLWALFMGAALWDAWVSWRVRGSPLSKTPQHQEVAY